MYNLMQGDCFERMKEIPDGSVDMILTDPPYGTIKGVADGDVSHGMKGKTSWDDTIDHKKMLSECNRVLRPNGSLILFSQDPYTAQIMTEVHGNLPFSYRMTWLKDHFANSLIAKKAPVSYTEDICLFRCKKGIDSNYDFDGAHPLRPYAKEVITYIGKSLKNINNELGHRRAEHFFYIDSTQFLLCTEKTYSELINMYSIDMMPGFRDYHSLALENIAHKAGVQECRDKYLARFAVDYPVVFNLPDGKKYKSNVLEYKKDYTGLHPTQKPVALMEDLIRTYTNEGDTVLDFTMGSGSTGVAAVNTSRNFIGIELDEGYFKIAKQRIKQAEIEKNHKMNYNCV